MKWLMIQVKGGAAAEALAAAGWEPYAVQGMVYYLKRQVQL